MEKREQILVAAMDLFIENGVQATPMSAIAKAAQTGMGTIYNYFATKEELINAIYLYIKLKEIDAISAPYESSAIKRQFEQFYSAMIRYFVSHPQHFRFMDQFQASPVLTRATLEAGTEAFSGYLELLRKGQEQGIVKNLSIHELVQFVSGGMMGFIRGLLIAGTPLTQTMLDNHLRLAWDAIKE